MKIIGRIDKADFPEFNLKNVNIKVDTGAYTSSIHSYYINEVEFDGNKYLEFKILDPTYSNFPNKIFRTKNYSTKIIKSSFGSTEQRFIIKTKIVIFNQEYPIELSLSERNDMKFPILIGRKFLNRQFVVNTSLKYMSYKQKIK
ncbi:MAG: ATP-dependent zinc protease [Bacteroidales bacterium]|nr:ATP-dependent zinc protease [Bacteroidales bacterium]